MQEHLIYMERCLALAELGIGAVSPNPMVGAVLVYQNRIIGEGWHQIYGQAHAEVNCVESVAAENTHLISQSTLYVSLEPCSHYGKTPPCTELIIRHRIPRVVIGCVDIFAKVSGMGIQKLKDAGIEVILEGPWNVSCQHLNRRFFTFHQQKRPYISLKWAESTDHFIAAAGQKGSSDRIRISHPITDRLVHRWRSEEAAIMIGKNTGLLDDPALNTRLWSGRNPIRIIIDKDLQMPPTAKIFQSSGELLVFNRRQSSTTNHDQAEVRLEQLDWNQQILPQLLAFCYRRNIQSILVEGGRQLLNSFLEARLWDECRIITNTQLKLKAGIHSPALRDAELTEVKCLGQDKISYFAAQRD